MLVGGLAVGMAVLWSAPTFAGDDEQVLVTFSGLRIYDDGSSTLFVNLTDQAPISMEKSGKRLDFMIKGARVHLRNNKNPLQAQYFKTMVVRAKLDDVRQGVRLRVDLRSDVEPAHRLVREGQRAVLHVDFPPPT
jgi:hypothetical protein